MNTIKLNFSDFWDGFDKENNFFINLLRQKYSIVISDNPDFLIYSLFGTDYLKFNCVRIFYTAENFTPNFNLCDYGMGFDWLTFDDRYFRLPYYYVRNFSEAYKKAVENKQYNKTDMQNRKFCNFVYSNEGADKRRTDFYNLLSAYKSIHSGGRYLNNIGGRIDDKLKFQQQFKFSIAFENSSTFGYTTEKIIEAKVAGTIPIYWGNPLISREMNTKAFINCHDFNNFKEVIERTKELDQNDNDFIRMLNEPLFQDTIYEINDNKILNFFNNIISVKEKQRNGHFQKNMEKKLKQYYFFEKAKNILKHLKK